MEELGTLGNHIFVLLFGLSPPKIRAIKLTLVSCEQFWPEEVKLSKKVILPGICLRTHKICYFKHLAFIGAEIVLIFKRFNNIKFVLSQENC